MFPEFWAIIHALSYAHQRSGMHMMSSEPLSCFTFWSDFQLSEFQPWFTWLKRTFNLNLQANRLNCAHRSTGRNMFGQSKKISARDQSPNGWGQASVYGTFLSPGPPCAAQRRVATATPEPTETTCAFMFGLGPHAAVMMTASCPIIVMGSAAVKRFAGLEFVFTSRKRREL